MATINETNAYGFADYYSIVRRDIGSVVATEHNETEAKALASWLNNRNGGGYSVRRNTPDQVRAAKALGRAPLLHPRRQEAFEETGVW